MGNVCKTKKIIKKIDFLQDFNAMSERKTSIIANVPKGAIPVMWFALAILIANRRCYLNYVSNLPPITQQAVIEEANLINAQFTGEISHDDFPRIISQLGLCVIMKEEIASLLGIRLTY